MAVTLPNINRSAFESDSICTTNNNSNIVLGCDYDFDCDTLIKTIEKRLVVDESNGMIGENDLMSEKEEVINNNNKLPEITIENFVQIII